jgi:hypothetical protein
MSRFVAFFFLSFTWFTVVAILRLFLGSDGCFFLYDDPIDFFLNLKTSGVSCTTNGM